MSLTNYKFHIEYRKSAPFNMDNKHSHELHEIYYLQSGERYYFIDDRIYHVNPGDIIFIPKKVLHRTTAANNDNHERTVLYFNDSFLAGLAPNNNKQSIMTCFYRESKALRLKVAEQNTIETILAKMVAEYKNPKEDSEIYLKSLLIQLLVHTSRISPIGDGANFDPLNPIHDKIHKIVRYIRHNYQKPICLAEIAEQFYISQFYLCRMFKEVTGLTLIEYLNNIRIKEAQQLLEKTDLSITEISGLVGYENQTYFGRMFKRITGTTPREYRKARFTI
ncbi:MAG: AraC family transcriptional regulator [Firmicutes bacterium]|nr:AraC family transcriptional regulator [Bacillota bacterium]